MNKNNYVSFIKSTDDKINKLDTEKLLATKKYVEENVEFGIGDLIKIYTPEMPYWSKTERGILPSRERLAFVYGYDVIKYTGEIKYLLKEQKKDGTMSKKRDYYSDHEILTFVSNDV